MFAPRVVGTANAFSAGWGNLGGGVAQWCMPLLAGAAIGLGADRFLSWRLAMIVPGIGMFITGFLYYRFTEDTPDGRPFAARKGTQAFWEAAADYRVWLLFLLYAACFGVEITIDNVAALYFKDSFHVGLKLAGLLASATGMMNIFARALGGIAGDWAGGMWGLRGRSLLLGLVVFAEGIALTMFSRLTSLVFWSAWRVESLMLSCHLSNPGRSDQSPASWEREATSEPFARAFYSRRKVFRGHRLCRFWGWSLPLPRSPLCCCGSAKGKRRKLRR
jgi:nitrate/nitrite transporter NarK